MATSSSDSDSDSDSDSRPAYCQTNRKATS
jgi:hypothetical protein